MKLSTMVIETIEMTRAEAHALFEQRMGDRWVAGRKVMDWNMDDGHNEILLEGESIYRPVVICEIAQAQS